MRILYFYQYFATREGSWGTRAYEFARRWAATGTEVTVVTGVYDKSDLRVGRGLVQRRLIDGIDVRVVNVRFSNKHGLARRAWSFFVYAVVSVWVALTVRADVVVASSGPITTAIPAIMAKLIRRVPMVLEVRDLWPEVVEQMGLLQGRASKGIARAFAATCYRMSSLIVVLSPGMKEWVEAAGYRHVIVVPNAADNDLFSAPAYARCLPNWARESHVMLFAGTMGVANDCDQLIEAAEQLQRRGRSDITVTLIGDGSERERLMVETRRRRLGNVRFLDPVPKTALVPWLQSAASVLLVLRPIPVFDTSSPNKLFDALAAGAPVVQTTGGWIRDLLEEHQCGLSVPSRDPERMADALELIADHPELRARMGMRGRELARTMFDRDLLAEHMSTALRNVADGEAGLAG